MKLKANYHEPAKLRAVRSPQFYFDVVDKHPQSGLTLAQYCRKHQPVP